MRPAFVVVVLFLAMTVAGAACTASGGGSASVGGEQVGEAKQAVLNGTATSGLAHRVALKLTGGGFKQGMVTTATDQTRTTTTVAYLPGHRRDAQAVAVTLKLSPGSVAAADQNTQAVACPPPAACTATVVVTVGADLANLQ